MTDLRLPILQSVIDRMPPRFRWTLHNLVAHPTGEILFHLGLRRVGDWLHDATVPTHERGTGRG